MSLEQRYSGVVFTVAFMCVWVEVGDGYGAPLAL
jgi:hypothetical protein